MDKRKQSRRVVELCKDVLILLLTCSAVWLATRTQLLGPLSGLLGREENPGAGSVQTESGARADAARPLRITANVASGTENARYGIQYDTAASDALFQQVAGLLVEALSSAGAPEPISRAQWEQAQNTALGMTFDFQGELPLEVLMGWMSGEDTGLTARVRRLTLTVWQDHVALYYRDEETGTYFRCLSEVASQRHLTEALAGLSGNGSFYAFESEQYRMLDRDTLITEQPPASAVYTAANPMNRGQDSLKELMGDLGISVNGSNFYLSGSEEVVRSGDGSIRLSSDGVAVYAAGEGGPFKIPPRNGKVSLFDAVEACRQVAANTLGTRSGQARLYLMSARETETGLVVRFGYCLNGYLVRLDQGYAAQFLVRDGEITDFTLCFRSYTDSGTTSPVLPIRQAAAAMEAMGLTGEELLLAYSDSRGDTVTASWMAADSHLTERG